MWYIFISRIVCEKKWGKSQKRLGELSDNDAGLTLSEGEKKGSECINIYIYIYIYTHTHIHISSPLCGVSGTTLLGYFWSGRVRSILVPDLNQFQDQHPPPSAVWPPQCSASFRCITWTSSAQAGDLLVVRRGTGQRRRHHFCSIPCSEHARGWKSLTHSPPQVHLHF